ncbi:MAG TPA: hypothetical protein VFW69_08510 [Mycobacterium sp.]|nr:hypothetical protein [Mycobacterium sp.]
MRSTIGTVVVIGCAIVALPTPTAWAGDDFVALAVSVASGRSAGWGAGGSQDQASQIALASCTAEAGPAISTIVHSNRP